MIKKKNTGFSMVEILISLAIFMILMLPIVSGIISSLNMTTSSKELQYRNDFAENLMEHIKAVPIDQVTDEEYYVANGTLAGTFEFGGGFVTTVDPTDLTERKSCTMKGKTTIGTKSSTYNYLIQVNNDYYVDKGVNDAGFIDPNNLALGIVEDIDHTKVALFDGTMLNYDKMASAAFRTKKLQALKEIDEDRYNQQMQGIGVDLFLADTASRMMTVEVSGNSRDGYIVRCVLDYIDHDLNGILGDNNHIQYVSDAQTFADKLPNIYLMYNPCVYNGDYSLDDYIAIDTSGLDESEVNLFFVETAATYSQNIVNSGTVDDKVGKILYNDVRANSVGRDNVNIHMLAKTKESGDNTLDRIHVYHNIGDNIDSEGNLKSNQKSAAHKFWYKADSAVTADERSEGVSGAMDGRVSTFLNLINDGASASERITIAPLVSGGSKDATVGLLNQATEESRGLYQVKIWMKPDIEGPIDTSVDQPILQGTKGGNET